MSTEKRQSIRVPSSRPIVVIHQEKNYFSTMTDFSEHGLGFMSMANFDRDTRIELHFDLPDPEGGLVSFQVKAEVKHCMNLPQENHIGVKVDSMQKEYSQTFASFYAA